MWSVCAFLKGNKEGSGLPADLGMEARVHGEENVYVYLVLVAQGWLWGVASAVGPRYTGHT